MPFIHIKSLPFATKPDISSLIANLSQDFCEKTGVDREHVTVTWEFFNPGYYAVAGIVAMQQPKESHPILVDLLAPDFNTEDQVANMLLAVAHSIAKHTNIPADNVFINYRRAHAGMVFDAGEIVKW